MLPSVASYPLPTEVTSFENRVNWPADPQRSALLIHDMQRYFLQPFGEDAALTRTLITQVERMRALAHDLNIPVFYTAQPPRQAAADRGLLTDFWGQGLQRDEDAEIVAQLSPTAGDTVLTKWRYDAFTRSDLSQRLEALGRDQLVIGGIYTSIGITTTATSAFMQDIQTFIVADATADFSEEQHRDALYRAAQHCARVLTCDTLLQEWEHPAART